MRIRDSLGVKDGLMLYDARQLDTGVKVLLNSGEEAEICCLLATLPLRRYSVRNIHTRGIHEVLPTDIQKVYKAKSLLKKPSSDVNMIKRVLSGDKKAAIEFVKRFKKMPKIKR